MTKYAQRDGWSHGDVLRLAHIRPATDTKDAIFSHVRGRAKEEALITEDVADYMAALEEVSDLETPKDRVKTLITNFGLPFEVIPTELRTDPSIWEALLPSMGLEAMIRNLATMTRIGTIGLTGDIKRFVLDRLEDEEAIRASRLHPVKVLQALKTYESGRSLRGDSTWKPIPQIVGALDAAFYKAFQNVKPTNKRVGLFLDVSGSMTTANVNGLEDISACMASAAMAMVTVNTERDYVTKCFSSPNGSYCYDGNRTVIGDLSFRKNLSLLEAMDEASRSNWGRTDCALPMIWAKNNKVEIDAFTIFTDNETYAGRMAPTQALEQYRQAMGIDAKLIVVGMSASNFTIADPKDPRQMDVVGFDTAAPAILSDFIR